MKPVFDLDKLIKRIQEEEGISSPGDSARIQEGVSFSMQKKQRKPSGFVDGMKINEKVTVSLQNKIKGG